MAAKCWRHCFPIITIWQFFQHSRARISETCFEILLKFGLHRDFMVVLFTCKSEKDLIKNGQKSWRHRFAILLKGKLVMSDWPNPGRIRTWSRLYSVLVPASMKRLTLNMAEKSWWHCFPHYKSMVIFFSTQGHLTLKPALRFCWNSNSAKPLWLSSLPASMKKIW